MARTGKKHTELTDRELVNLALQNDQAAFASLLAKYRNALMRHIMKYVTVTEDVEDICQRSFEKAFVRIDRYDPKYAFSTWLYNIAQNEAIDHLRRMKSNIASVSISSDNEAMNVLSGITPEEEVIIDQAVSKMIMQIKSLPEGYREVAELRFIKDYAYEDISVELDIPIGTVKTRLNRARKMLSRHSETAQDGKN